MTKRKKRDEKPTTEPIVSFGVEVLGNRFRVKVSKMDNGVTKESFMVATQDLLEDGFSLKYFDSNEEVVQFLKLLTAATK